MRKQFFKLKKIDEYKRYFRNIVEEAASLGVIIIVTDILGGNPFKKECELEIRRILERYSVEINKTIDRHYK